MYIIVFFIIPDVTGHKAALCPVTPLRWAQDSGIGAASRGGEESGNVALTFGIGATGQTPPELGVCVTAARARLRLFLRNLERYVVSKLPPLAVHLQHCNQIHETVPSPVQMSAQQL